jgi:hypothetical protein
MLARGATRRGLQAPTHGGVSSACAR